jgi:hypothetical protein
MSMKRLMMIAALAASLVGCVANQGDAPIRFLGTRELTSGSDSCGLGDRQLTSGRLDISSGNSYLLGLSVETNTVEQETSVNGIPVGGAGLSDITLTEIVLSYDSEPSLALPKEESIPYYAVFRPETSGDSFALFYVLGPKALTVLQESVTSDAAASVLVTVKGRGRMSGGQVVETNEITFPITVSSSDYQPATGTCANPSLAPVKVPGPCGNYGQDMGPICRLPTTTTP